MSATANNAGAGWNNVPVETAGNPAHPRAEGGRNALQALLAFACIHEQSGKRRETHLTPSLPTRTRVSKEDEFALDEVLQLVADRAITITGADGIAIALADEKAIVCRASSGRIAPDRGIALDPSSGFSGACLRSGETVRCDDSETDSRVDANACRKLGARSMVAVPLSAKQRVIGLVEAFSTESFGFNDSDVRSLNLLSELILAAIRPEEEDRLADLARRVLANTVQDMSRLAEQTISQDKLKPAPVQTPIMQQSSAVEQAPSAANDRAPASTAVEGSGAVLEDQTSISSPAAKLLLDEKFTPPAASSSSIKTARPVATVGRHATTPEQPEAAPQQETTPLFTAQIAHDEHRSRLSILITIAASLVAVALLVGLVWKARKAGQAISANTTTTAEAKAAEPMINKSPAPAQPPVKPGALPLVSGVQHSSKDDVSTVVIDVQDQVQYEEHSLDNPPRVYFDLHDTRLSPDLENRNIELNDAYLKRVRIAQPVDGVTRVVLETKDNPGYSVSLESNPYRLIIQVHKPSATPSPQPGTLTKPSPAIGASPKKTSSQSTAARGNFSIVLDAGHGGWDLGTVGRKGLLEKDLVLDIVQRLGELLQTKLDVDVIYTRQDDSYLALEKRAEIANLAKADLFLSVHANYSDLSTARGVETYYTDTYSSIKARTAEVPTVQEVNWSSVVNIRAKVLDSRRFATDIEQALYGGLAARNPDIRNRGVKKAEYVVLAGTQMPAALAEVSFVSSPADEDKLQNSEYRQLIAEALYRGIARYYKDSSRVPAKAQIRTASHRLASPQASSPSTGTSD